MGVMTVCVFIVYRVLYSFVVHSRELQRHLTDVYACFFLTVRYWRREVYIRLVSKQMSQRDAA